MKCSHFPLVEILIPMGCRGTHDTMDIPGSKAFGNYDQAGTRAKLELDYGEIKNHW